MHGRAKIYTVTPEITAGNVVDELNKAMFIHGRNANEIDYLYKYFRGIQPILEREKPVRPEITNRIVENHAYEIVRFKTGYMIGEPITYVQRGDGKADDVSALNDAMFEAEKASCDREIAQWMYICGLAARMIQPGSDKSIEIDAMDPRNTFCVYHAGFGHRPVMGVTFVLNQDKKRVFGVYTSTRYFEIIDGKLMREQVNTLGMIPIFEYELNPERMGAFEPVLPLLDALNNLTSNRVDDVEQFVQAFLKFVNCDIDEEGLAALAQLGAIKIKGEGADVERIDGELNQSQVQVLVDYCYEKILTICGVPSTTKGGTSTSDTGAAVIMRDGWQQAESNAREDEEMFKRSERKFLTLAIRILRNKGVLKLDMSDVDIKFSRRNTDNLLTKTQSLLHMLEAGIAPVVAIATCGLWNDPMDVSAQSAEFLRKWDYEDMVTDNADAVQTS